MTGAEGVRLALRALALGTAGSGRPTRPARAVVRAAEEAAADVTDAAAFVEDGGLERLDRSVEAARRRDERDLARRGQRARALFERYRRAADRSSGPDAARPDSEVARFDRDAARSGEATRTDREASRSRQRDGSDHFHLGHGTVLGDSGQRTDE